jgi:hypothetical protein
MATPIGIGCAVCNADIADAETTMPATPGYLSAANYIALYADTPQPWPSPYIDGEYVGHVMATIEGSDGWLTALHCRDRGNGVRQPGLCACGSGNLELELYRGRTEIR